MNNYIKDKLLKIKWKNKAFIINKKAAFEEAAFFKNLVYYFYFLKSILYEIPFIVTLPLLSQGVTKAPYSSVP